MSKYTRRYLAILCAPVTLGFQTGAQAATFCVHNADEFASTIISAEGDGEGNTIQLTQGTYALSGHLDYESATDIQISGGWNSDCSQATVNPLNTVIDGGNTYFVFFKTDGGLTIDGIHFDHVAATQLSAAGFTIRHNIFTGSQGTDVVQVQSSSGVALLDSNVFDHKNVEVANFDGTDSNTITWHIINNTFLNAAVGTSDELLRAGYGLVLSEPGEGSNLHIVLANNILWNNATGGIRISRYPEVLATHNNWQSLANIDGVAMADGSVANTSADPQVDGSYHPIAPGSSSINTGTITFPGSVGATDVGGGPRIVGTAPDRGAYESQVNDTTTLMVTNNADSGIGSLRQALTDAASSPQAQNIAFNLAQCPTIINVDSALPAIVDTLTIDGYTQSGASANTLPFGSNARLCVILNGNYPSSEGLTANNVFSHVTVHGLAFENFGFAAIDFTDGDSHLIQGNQFGGSLANGRSRPIALSANARGVRLAEDSADSIVGGIDPQLRNVVDGSTVYGIALADNLGGHEVINNYIGLGPNGSTAAGNAVGLIVSSANNLVDRNYIGGSMAEGVRLQGNPTFMGYPQGNALTGNIIGLPAVQGSDSLQNYGAGVRLTDNANGNFIGVDMQGQISGNEIVGNGLYGSSQSSDGYGGISVESGIENRISGNTIYANFGLAIDLGSDGPTPNDATDSDTGANMLQNFPELSAVQHVGGTRNLSGSIYITSNTKIEVFAAPACGGSGRADAIAALSTNAAPLTSPNGHGTVTFTLDILRGPGTGVDQYCRIGATATDANGNTSEMSACFVDDTIFAHGFENAAGYSCAP